MLACCDPVERQMSCWAVRVRTLRGMNAIYKERLGVGGIPALVQFITNGKYSIHTNGTGVVKA